jgi:uncharacterized membrane protein YphA (DoxX/SURF4 family)
MKIRSFFMGLLCATTLWLPFAASAHVGYVVDPIAFKAHEGSDVAFLWGGVAHNPADVFVAAICTLLLVGAIVYVRSRPRVKHFLVEVRAKLATYQELLPWMARLSLGIALIGAGTANAWISPVLSAHGAIGFVEIVLGFCFLVGFLLTPAFLVTIGLFIAGLTQSTYLVGNMDFLALALALFLLDSARPGLDDILNIPEVPARAKLRALVPLVLRLGLGTAFIFLGVFEKFLNPHDSELVVQIYNLTHVIPVSPALWVLGAGMIEVLLGVLLILGYEIRLTAMVAFVVISLSFFYFKESVYSHVTLFGALSMLVTTGAGKYSLDGYLRRR